MAATSDRDAGRPATSLEARRLLVLSSAMRAFAETAADYPVLLDTVVRRVGETLGCMCNVALIGEDGAAMELAAAYDADPVLVAAVRRLRSSTPVASMRGHPLFAVVEAGQSVVVPPEAMAAVMAPLRAEREAVLGDVVPTSVLIAPLRARGVFLGVMSLMRHGPGAAVFDEDDRALAENLADHAALAILTARLVAAQQREAAHSRGLAERARLLSDVAREFAAATVDYDALLEVIARRLGELLGELCTIRAISRDRSILESTLAVYHPDPAVVAMVRDAAQREPQRLGEGVTGRVAASGERVFAPSLDPAQALAIIAPRFRPIIERAGFASLMVVPLIVRGDVIGVAQLSRGQAGDPYTEDDLRLFEDVAAHASVAISNARAYADERRARQALRQSEEAHRLLFDASPLPLFVFDAETLRFAAVNDAAVDAYGYTRDELLARALPDLWLPEDAADQRAQLHAAAGTTSFAVTRHRRKDGSVISVERTARPLVFGGRPSWLAVVKDVTEQHRLEEQLRQAQKMEAIGRLAGGVAHDFNNVLTVILSYCTLMGRALPEPDPMRSDVGEIERAAERAATLTRQLLTFSRQQVVEPRQLDLNEVVAGMDRMLRRLIGEDVELHIRLAPGIDPIEADPGQIEQVIMNLVVNARDAMPTGGTLTIETANATLDERYARDHVGAVPGPYVKLAIADTGCGMDRETRRRIFEPFFTTKPQGKGTGLGLSTVFGIVQQSHGTIGVSSEPGVGTTFELFLPRADEHSAERPAVAPPPTTLYGSETVLLVEDEDQVRLVARRILSRHGYHVLEARSADEALRLAQEYAGPIHLLLSDVVMPQMGGVQLARRIAALRPTVRVVCMSGYTDEAIVHHGLVGSGIAFVQKPFTPEAVARKVREVLDAAPSRASS
jgi:PAS domain S-box-containing protein